MDQSFDIAQGHNEMDTFARIVQASAKPVSLVLKTEAFGDFHDRLDLQIKWQVDYQRIAQYYESRGEYDKAGDMLASSGQESKAVQLYLKVSGVGIF